MVGCSEMKKEEDKRDEKEKNQKSMGKGTVMGRIHGKDEVGEGGGGGGEKGRNHPQRKFCDYVSLQ